MDCPDTLYGEPDDELFVKSAQWHAERRKGIGGSDAGKIMNGEWLPLWLEKTGRSEPEDLSDNLAVIMGTYTEALNRWWFSKQTGFEVLTDSEPFVSDVFAFMRANLDGVAYDGRPGGSVFEAKHVSAFAKADEIVSRYVWQVYHNMAVTGMENAFLSVFYGNSKWEYYPIARDESAIADLITREQEFWRYVESDTPPPEKDSAAPIKIAFDTMREVDMSGSNSWANYATEWLQCRPAAKKFEAAEKEIKALVEQDVKLAYGHGIAVKRSSNNALRIGEMK